MVLNFGTNLFGKGIFKNSPEDDQVSRSQGSRNVPGDAPVQALVDISPTDTTIHSKANDDNYTTATTIILTPTSANNLVLRVKLQITGKTTSPTIEEIRFTGGLGTSSTIQISEETYTTKSTTKAFSDITPASSYTVNVQYKQEVSAADVIFMKDIILTITYLDNTTTTIAGAKWGAWT